jgi:hypothetical protein
MDPNSDFRIYWNVLNQNVRNCKRFRVEIKWLAHTVQKTRNFYSDKLILKKSGSALISYNKTQSYKGVNSHICHKQTNKHRTIIKLKTFFTLCCKQCPRVSFSLIRVLYTKNVPMQLYLPLWGGIDSHPTAKLLLLTFARQRIFRPRSK